MFDKKEQKIKFVLFAIAALLCFQLLSDISNAGNFDIDELEIQRLKKLGSDIRKPHEFNFFFYFKREEDATTASKALKKMGYANRVAKDKPFLLVIVEKTMIPEVKVLQDIRNEFNKIAEQYSGDYDGWETSIQH